MLFAVKSDMYYLTLQSFFRIYERRITVWQKTGNGTFYFKKRTFIKRIFFCMVKNFPQQIQNTREIIENMSEIIQNISDIFFAIYTPADFQVLER